MGWKWHRLGQRGSPETSYDAVTNMWTPAGNMPHPHDQPTATLLPNGQVLVASESTAELYYP